MSAKPASTSLNLMTLLSVWCSTSDSIHQDITIFVVLLALLVASHLVELFHISSGLVSLQAITQNLSFVVEDVGSALIFFLTLRALAPARSRPQQNYKIKFVRKLARCIFPCGVVLLVFGDLLFMCSVGSHVNVELLRLCVGFLWTLRHVIALNARKVLHSLTGGGLGLVVSMLGVAAFFWALHSVLSALAFWCMSCTQDHHARDAFPPATPVERIWQNSRSRRNLFKSLAIRRWAYIIAPLILFSLFRICGTATLSPNVLMSVGSELLQNGVYFVFPHWESLSRTSPDPYSKGDFESELTSFSPETQTSDIRHQSPHLIVSDMIPDNRRVAGVVIVILESARADEFSYGASSVNVNHPRRHHHSAPSRSLFISRLANMPGTTVARRAFSAMPNTNKSLLQALCGLTPLLDTTWIEFEHGLKKNVREECLARRLSKDMGWATLFASSSHVDPENIKSSVQASIGFESVLGSVDLWPRCRAYLSTKEPSCSRIHMSPFIASLIRGTPNRLRGTADDECVQSLQAFDQNNSISLREALVQDMSSRRACGTVDGGPPLSREQLTFCLSSSCSLPKDDESSPLMTQVGEAADDELLVEPTLDFVESALEQGKHFAVALLTSGTHYPYKRRRDLSSSLGGLLTARRLPSSNRTSTATTHVPANTHRKNIARRLVRHQISAVLTKNTVKPPHLGEIGGTPSSFHGAPPEYHSAIRRADELVRRIFEGLGSLSPSQGGEIQHWFKPRETVGDRTLLVVVGDHGEAFGEGGHRQHGSCVYVPCLQVPFLVHDPFRQKKQRPPPISSSTWREGFTSLSDIMPTILAWSGYYLANGSTSGTLLRQGVSVLPESKEQVRRVLRVFSFFNPLTATILLLEKPSSPPGQPPGSSFTTSTTSNHQPLPPRYFKGSQLLTDRGSSALALRLPLDLIVDDDVAAPHFNSGLAGNSKPLAHPLSQGDSIALAEHLSQHRTSVRNLYRNLYRRDGY